QSAVVALKVATLTWPCVIGLQYGALLVFGVERIAWRYINMLDAMRILTATVISAAVLVALRIAHLLPVTTSIIPLGVLSMDFVLGLVGLIGARAAWRVH